LHKDEKPTNVICGDDPTIIPFFLPFLRKIGSTRILFLQNTLHLQTNRENTKMTDKIIKLDTINQYNEYWEVETLHPLVSVVDFSKCKASNNISCTYCYGFYTIFLKDIKCGALRYGRNYYDYQEGTLVFLAPGQVYSVEAGNAPVQPKGYGLLFHPDLLRGTSLGRNIGNYTFFSYEVKEALHLSEQERKVVMECITNIGHELEHSIDKHSKTLIVSNIELFLNYCTRFYDRQFITRSNANKDMLSQFEDILNNYFNSDKPKTIGLPSVAYCAERLHLLANYFGDLIKKETGKTAQEHIQLKMIDIAKERIFDPSKSISEIAYEMGFKYPQHFTRLFKSRVGITPNEYRTNI